MRARRLRDRRVFRAACALAGPALLAIGVFFYLPVIAALALSLTDFDLYSLADASQLRFVGAENYVRLATEPLFWQALGNTLWFALLAGPLQVAVALAAALALDAHFLRGRAFFRAAFLIPVVTTLVAVAVVWRYLYHPRSGLLNHLLGGVGLGPVDWLGEPLLAMPSLVAMSVWKGFGFSMLVFLAGLQAIPDRVYEAARIDGANRWHQLCFVTFPMLRPTFVFVGVMTVIGSLQLFAEPYVMTGGGPANATLSLVLLMYREGFRWWDLGRATALAFVLFAIVLALGVVALRLRGGAAQPGDASAGGAAVGGAR
jgi:multiple sugar transport system permease protein